MKKILLLLTLLITATIVCRADGEWDDANPSLKYPNPNGAETEGKPSASHIEDAGDTYLGLEDGRLIRSWGTTTLFHCVTLPSGIKKIESDSEEKNSLIVTCSNGCIYKVCRLTCISELLSCPTKTIELKLVATTSNGGTTYGATSSGDVYSKDKIATEWIQKASVSGTPTGIGADGNAVVITTEKNNTYAVNSSTDGAQTFSKTEMGSDFFSGAIPIPNRFGWYYVYGTNGLLYEYDATNSKVGKQVATGTNKGLNSGAQLDLNTDRASSQANLKKAPLKSAMLLKEEEVTKTAIFVGDEGLYLFAKSDGTLSEPKQIPGCNEFLTGVGANYVVTIDTISPTTLKKHVALVAYAWGGTGLWRYDEAVDSAYYNLSVSEDTIEIPWAGTNNITFSIASNDNWEFTSTQTWLTTEPASGSGDATVTLIAGANPTFDARTDTLTITGDEGLVQTVVITQAGAEPYISVSESSLTISGIGGIGNGATFEVGSNISWGVLSNQSWLTASPTSGTGNGTVTVTAEENPTVTKRNGIVTVSSDGLASQTVNVTQAAAAATLAVSPSTLNVAAIAGSTATFTISSNSNWSVLSDQAWLTVGSASGTGNIPIIVTAEANLTITERTAIVTVSADGVTSQTVTVTQAAGAATLSVSPSTLNVAAIAGSTATFTISSNSNWSVLSDQAWLTVGSASGTGNSPVTVTAKANPTVTGRTTIVTVLADGVASQTVTVNQAAGAATFSVSPATLEIRAEEGSTGTFNIVSNITWLVSSGQTWLSTSPATDTGDVAVTLTADANPSVGERTAIVTVSSDGLASQTVTVTQAAGTATLTVSPSTLEIGAKEGSTATFYITSNLIWDINCDQGWLTLSDVEITSPSDSASSRYNGNATVTLLSGVNNTTENRTATITVSSGAASQTVTVTQAAGVATLLVSPSSLESGATEGSTASFDVVSNTTWSASSDQTWLTVNPASGTGDGVVTLTSEANPSTSERSAMITVSASGATSQTVTVTQSGMVGISENEIAGIYVYPNPFSNGFYVDSRDEITVVSLYDLRGRVVLKRVISGIEYIPAGQLKNGIYLIEFTVDCVSRRGKMVKNSSF